MKYKVSWLFEQNYNIPTSENMIFSTKTPDDAVGDMLNAVLCDYHIRGWSIMVKPSGTGYGSFIFISENGDKEVYSNISVEEKK